MSGPSTTPGTTTLRPDAVRRADWRTLVGGAVIAAGAIAAYSRTFSVPLVFDDITTVANNPTLRNWRAVWSPPFNTTAAGRPILNLSLAINYAVSGTAVWSYHVANLAIHILAGLTLFGILRRTLAPRAGRAAARIAFSAALLWTLHPLQTEAVTYIVQRAESLMGLFYLLTVYAFIRGAEAGGPGRSRWFACSGAACLLGMATKEVMVSAPVMVLLYDRTFLAGTVREAWRQRWRLYAALGATWIVLPFLVLSTHGRAGTDGFGSGVTLWRYGLTQFPAIVRYLKLSVWPHPLVFDYATQWVPNFQAVWPSAVVVAGLAAASLWALFRPNRGARALGFAGTWFFAILAPTSLVPGNRQTAAEHRMYLALIPVVVLVVIVIYRRLGRAALPFRLALAVALGAVTWRRNEDYRSAVALWADTAAKVPANPFAHNNLGYELAKLPGRGEEAIAQYEEALRLRPEDAEARNNLGLALEKTPGRLPEAIAQYEAALRLEPGLAEAHYNLGNALEAEGRTARAITEYAAALRLKPDYAEAHDNLGNALNAEGRTREAIAQYETALRLQSGLAEAHNNLGYVLATMPGRLLEAIAEYEAALRLEPGFAEADNNLGNALEAEGRTADAIIRYETALRLQPGYAEAHNDLGDALNAAGRTAEAIAEYEAALRLKPNYAAAHYNLGNALEAEGRTEEAVAEYGAALRLKADYPEAHNNLGNALERLRGRLPEAIAQYEEALRLKPDDPGFHFNLAVALLRTPGRIDEVVAQLEAALRLQPGNVSARRLLDRILASRP